MAKIEIRVIGSTPLEALSAVTAFGMRCMDSKEIRKTADEILAAEHKSATGDGFAAEHDTAICQTPDESDRSAADPQPMPQSGATQPLVPVTPAPCPAPPAAVAAPSNGQTTAAPVVPTAPAPSITLEQVGKAGADLIAANPAKMQELLALLKQFGVPAITELKPEQLGPFATALRALGGNL